MPQQIRFLQPRSADEAVALLDRYGDEAKVVADGYAERVDTLSDMRGSAWYRTEMVRVWVRQAIERARDLAARSA